MEFAQSFKEDSSGDGVSNRGGVLTFKTRSKLKPKEKRFVR